MKKPKFRLEIGGQVLVRDNWLKESYMLEPGTIVFIAYEKNTDIGAVYLVQFDNFESHWFHRIALKTE